MNIAVFLSLAIASTIPVLATSLGGLFAERARATNIGMDGSMLVGALAALAVADHVGSAWLGLLAGMVAGAVLALLLAFTTYVLRSDIIIGGIAWNLVASGLSLLVITAVFHQPGTYAPSGVDVLPRVNLGPLVDLPLLGRALSGQSVLVWITLVLVVVAWVVMNRTRFGLHVRATGINEEAVRAAGINPTRIRILTLLISGLAAGLGGSFLTISSVAAFNSQVTNGAGFIALAAIIFGRATVLGSTAASLLFGFSVAVALQLQASNIISPMLLGALPYVVTISVLALYGIRQHRRTRFQSSDTNFTPVIVPN